MSSYTHLLNSYLTTPLKPSSFQTNNDTSSLNPNFYKTDSQLQYTGLNQSLLPQGSSLTQQTINPEQYETNYVPKRQSVRTLSQTLDNNERHAYMNDPPVRQTNKSTTLKENQIGASNRDIASPDLETIRKKHEQNIAQAFEDLLKFKPSESLTKQAQPKPKENNYSNILKDIDACVNDMKRYAARPIQPLLHRTNPDYDSFESDDRKRSVPLSDISNLGHELPHSGGHPQRPSVAESSLQMPSLSKPLINEGVYSIDNFLPTRSVTGNTHRAIPIQNLGSSHRADLIHHLPTNRINSAAKPQPPLQNIQNIENRENYHKQGHNQPMNQREHDFVNAIKENLNRESNMSFSSELVDLLAKTLLKVMHSTTNTTVTGTTASTHRSPIIDEGVNISSIKTSPRPHQQTDSNKNQSRVKQLNLEKLEPVTFLPLFPITRDCQTQTENTEDNATPFIQGPHQNYHSAQFGGSAEYERPPTAGRPGKHSYTLSFSGEEHVDKNLYTSNTLHHHPPPPQYPNRYDQSEEKSHQRNSSGQIHESPYGENVSPNLFEQSRQRLSGLPRPNFTKTAGFAESLRRERSTSASKLRQTLGQQDRTLNLNTKMSDSFNTRPSHFGDQKPFFLSGSKSRINTRETDFNTVSHISKEVFANDVKSNIENAFMEKVQNMQQSFTAFLKQKIDEIHDTNNNITQNTSGRKDSRIYSNTHRSSAATPQKLHATATFSSRPLSFSGANFHSFDNKVTLLKTSSASKPSRTSRIESTPPLKSARNEERSADFPRKTTEKDLQKSLAKQQGPKWKNIQFQEEQEIDRIILSYL